MHGIYLSFECDVLRNICKDQWGRFDLSNIKESGNKIEATRLVEYQKVGAPYHQHKKTIEATWLLGYQKAESPYHQHNERKAS